MLFLGGERWVQVANQPGRSCNHKIENSSKIFSKVISIGAWSNFLRELVEAFLLEVLGKKVFLTLRKARWEEFYHLNGIKVMVVISHTTKLHQAILILQKLSQEKSISNPGSSRPSNVDFSNPIKLAKKLEMWFARLWFAVSNSQLTNFRWSQAERGSVTLIDVSALYCTSHRSNKALIMSFVSHSLSKKNLFAT